MFACFKRLKCHLYHYNHSFYGRKIKIVKKVNWFYILVPLHVACQTWTLGFLPVSLKSNQSCSIGPGAQIRCAGLQAWFDLGLRRLANLWFLGKEKMLWVGRLWCGFPGNWHIWKWLVSGLIGRMIKPLLNHSNFEAETKWSPPVWRRPFQIDFVHQKLHYISQLSLTFLPKVQLSISQYCFL